MRPGSAFLERARRDAECPSFSSKATMALPPSQQNWLAGVTTPPNAPVMDARSSLGRTASMVAPVRSRATITGICSADKPRFAALLPLLRALRGRSDRFPLNDSRNYV